MRSLLCFGDSNTYGQIPGQGPLNRYDLNTRWPGVLRNHLGPDWHVIEEGLSGRTTISDDPVEGMHRNGKTYLLPCLMSHSPLDMIILMLGTNDLKIRFNKPASEIALGINVLLRDIMDFHNRVGSSCVPEILVVAPCPMHDDLKQWEPMFAGGQVKSRQLASEYKQVADTMDVHFFDAGSVATCSTIDGFHLDAEAHHAIGSALARKVTDLA